MTKSNIGTVIRERREQLDLTMIELAEKSGIAQSSISLIENGQRNPSSKTIKKLATALEIDPEELLTEIKSNEGSTQVEDSSSNLSPVENVNLKFNLLDFTATLEVTKTNFDNELVPQHMIQFLGESISEVLKEQEVAILMKCISKLQKSRDEIKRAEEELYQKVKMIDMKMKNLVMKELLMTEEAAEEEMKRRIMAHEKSTTSD